MTKPRITVAVHKDETDGFLEVFFYVNPEGRDLLVKELQHLDERWDHLHMQPEGETVDLPLQMKSYLPGRETLVPHVKMMLRPDDWDRQHFPHVMDDADA